MSVEKKSLSLVGKSLFRATFSNKVLFYVTMDSVSVQLKDLNKEIQVKIGTTLAALSEEYASELHFRPISATLNHLTVPLSKGIYEPCEIKFVSIAEESGMRTYYRTLCFIMAKALHDIAPERRFYVQHSISNGYYFTVSDRTTFGEDLFTAFRERVDQIIEEDIPIENKTIKTSDATAIFKEKGYKYVVDLLETTGRMYTTLQYLGDYVDSYQGSLAPSTGYIYLYDIISYSEGFLLRVPNRSSLDELAPMVHQPMMHQVVRLQDELIAMLDLPFVGNINKAIEANNTAEMILVSEAVQEKQIAAIAERIARGYQKGVRLVLVSGPSSSGKTTFTNRLCTQLLTCFVRPKMISLDNYFVDREKTPLASDGTYDFESLYALDLQKFNADLKAILDGEEVQMPIFDFYTGHRTYKEGNNMRLEDGEVLMLEGIHALNPELLSQIPSESTHKIYVSALTALGLDEHNAISTTTNRLLRRIVRDYSFRGYSALDTLRRWSGVRRGEDKWVFPYQEYADDMFNSSMVYELSALRPFAEPLLLDVPESEPEYAEAQRLLRFISFVKSLPLSQVPATSLLREFLGGSVYYS